MGEKNDKKIQLLVFNILNLCLEKILRAVKEKQAKLSNCGLDCNKCKFFEKICHGCKACKGKPMWLGFTNYSICPVYDCSKNVKALNNCGECRYFPCKLFLSLEELSILCFV